MSDWPNYKIGPREHIHALGVVSATFNVLELTLFLIFEYYTDLGENVALALFGTINNQLRLNLLKKCVAEREAVPEVHELNVQFAKGFDVCAENRNFLMHSQTYSFEPEILVFNKRARGRPEVTHTIDLQLRDIRRVADEIHGWDVFGMDIVLHLYERKQRMKRPPQLPEKPEFPSKPPFPEAPPLPRKLWEMHN